MNTDQHGLKHQALTERVIACFYETYNELGYGFLESVYEGAMAMVLSSKGVRFNRQVDVPVVFRGTCLGEYRADMTVEELVLLELKAVKELDSSHEAQTLNYLKATSYEVGLLLNFGPKPQVKRLVYDNHLKIYRPPAGPPNV